MITLGSLFAGIGGLELGLGWALADAGIPHRVAWQVEREPYPRAVLARHWPEADRSVVDVCTASRANLAPVDVICGGFPCQDRTPKPLSLFADATPEPETDMQRLEREAEEERLRCG